jgi:hypothetical protein
MPNRIVDVVDALNAGVASGEDFFVTVMDDGGGTGTFARDNWERYRSRARTRHVGAVIEQSGALLSATGLEPRESPSLWPRAPYSGTQA